MRMTGHTCTFRPSAQPSTTCGGPCVSRLLALEECQDNGLRAIVNAHARGTLLKNATVSGSRRSEIRILCIDRGETHRVAVYVIPLDDISRFQTLDFNLDDRGDPQMCIPVDLTWNGDAAVLEMEGLEAQTSFMVRRNALGGTAID
jgi:hypothetical protein